MTATYLLDTSILSDLVRHPHGAVAVRIADVGEDAVVTSVIVSAELRFGAAKRKSVRLSSQIEAILSRIEILDLQPPADQEYADIRAGLERAGLLVGSNDLLIAAQARSLGLTVVTANLSEFQRVPGLTVENWL